MATAAWLHGTNNTRLTEGLVSVLKEERPEYLPVLLTNYREHGVVGVQVRRPAAVLLYGSANMLTLAVLRLCVYAGGEAGSVNITLYVCSKIWDEPI